MVSTGGKFAPPPILPNDDPRRPGGPAGNRPTPLPPVPKTLPRK